VCLTRGTISWSYGQGKGKPGFRELKGLFSGMQKGERCQKEKEVGYLERHDQTNGRGKGGGIIKYQEKLDWG